jgi:putative ABC transport system substrate-binding protein
MLLVARSIAAGPPDGKRGGELEREFGFLEAEDVEKIPLSVVSRGPAIAAGQAPAVVDVITAQEIRSSGARTLAELLAQRVGIDVSIDRVVPRGLNTTASTAGITLVNHRTLLLVDGRPTNGLFFGDFLAGRELPLEYIERIEIIRGPGSALYGTNAMAGVINIVTKDYADEPGPGVIGEYGSSSTRRVDAFAGGGEPSRNGNFFLRYFASRGANRPDRNDDLRQYFGFARGTLGPLTVEAEGLDFARGEPGIEGATTPDDHVNRSRYSFGGRFDQPLGDEFRLTSRIYANLYQTRLQIAAAGTQHARSVYDERRVGEELALNYRPFDWLSVTFGGEVREEDGQVGAQGLCVSSTASGVVFENGCTLKQNVFAAFLEDQIALPHGFTFTGGFRYDDVTSSGSRLNPRLNLLWKPQAQTSLKVGYGEAFRAPSFFEQRGAQEFGTNTLVLGNDRLRPEVVHTVEGEIDHSISRELNLRLSSFYTYGRDLIAQQSSVDLLNTGICPPCGVPSNSVLAGLCPVIGTLGGLGLPILATHDVCFVNAVHVDVIGVEAAAGGVIGELPVPGELSYGVNYTYQDTKSRSTGIAGEPDLPLAPRHKANVLFEYRPIPELSIFSHTRVVGRQFADGVEKQSLERYVNEDVNLVYRATREVQLAVGLYNIAGDDRKEAFGVPREPRVVLGSVAYRFVPRPALPALPSAGEEPAELGEARAAVERARAAGAERVSNASYREALENLRIAEYLQTKGEIRSRVVGAAERAKQAADVAREAALAAEAAPPTSAPVATPTATPATKPPAVKHTPGAAGLPSQSPRGTAIPSPSQTPTPRPTPTPTATRKPTPDLASSRVLLLQSDGNVEIYREAAAKLVAELPGHVALEDLHGDRDQAIDVARRADADLVVAVGALAATVARQELTDRLVMFCAVLNPRRYKLSGGVSFEVSPKDQLARLHDALPAARRIGVIYDPKKSTELVAAAGAEANTLGLQLVPAEAHDPREVDPVFRSLRRDIDVLWLIPDSTVVTRESFEVLALEAAESRIPLVAYSDAFVQQGALLAISPDAAGVGLQCASLAEEALRTRRVPPVVLTAERYRVTVNEQVAQQFGLRIPTPAW